ncbi:hypothetical protein LEN26_008125 [Aphanomyces euteiches]|nr:hypothetical protein AeMF1_005745 [Aphanomyces euteiches]KAH9130867.1 hypothetical protein LEN26_008125 [Aphanomyces euteiches]KAH9188696.1 hypothetical protein AeNC1_009325 [Aphanomyces euteiches]
MERVDPFTVYARLETPPLPPSGASGHSNMIRKYYVEPERHVIVSRTVVEDAAVPHMTFGAVEDRCVWYEKASWNHIQLFFLHVLWTPDDADSRANGDDTSAAIVTLMRQVCFKSPRAQGLLPPTGDMEMRQVPLANMQVFADRGRRFLAMLKDHINDAVATYRSPDVQPVGDKV